MRLEELDTPALWVDLTVMERNLARMGSYCREHGLALRPHIKTHKTCELAHLQIQSGAVGITSAKVSEASVMADGGLKDILIAYPLWGTRKWLRLKALLDRARVALVTDSPEHARALADGLGGARRKVSLLVEIDVGLGRCGLPVDHSLPSRLTGIAESGMTLGGIMFYPGHMKTAVEEDFSALSGTLARALESYRKVCREDPPVVSGGSTPTAFRSHLIQGLTEIRPGTYIFNDCNTVDLGACTWEDCALRVRCTVVSTSVPGGAIIDGGSKTFSDARRNLGSGFGHLVQHPGILCEKMNEEHGYLSLKNSAASVAVGQRVDVIPNHACTAVNMHHLLYGVRDQHVERLWRIQAQGMIH